MEWIALGVAALIGYYIGISRTPRTSQQPSATASLERESAEDRSFLLSVLRRELANYLIRHDPDRFQRVYRKAHALVSEIAKSAKDHQQARLKVITDQYRFYSDLDIIATREHVLYADAVTTIGHDAIEAHYVRLIEFQALLHALDQNWSRYPSVRESDLEHLRGYVPKIKDTKFRQRILSAVTEFDAFRKDADFVSKADYETRRLSVCLVNHFAETRYGIHFKDTDEFGLYGTYYDDERDRLYEHCYRSNRMFGEETFLDYLRVEEAI